MPVQDATGMELPPWQFLEWMGVDAMPVLIYHLKKGGFLKRMESARILRRLSPLPEDQLERVIHIALQNADSLVRVEAVRILGCNGANPSAVRALVACLEDRTEEVCEAAVDALTEIAVEHGGYSIRSSLSTLYALLESDPNAFSFVVQERLHNKVQNLTDMIEER
jgi:HEAT repeat protein